MAFLLRDRIGSDRIQGSHRWLSDLAWRGRWLTRRGDRKDRETARALVTIQDRIIEKRTRRAERAYWNCDSSLRRCNGAFVLEFAASCVIFCVRGKSGESASGVDEGENMREVYVDRSSSCVRSEREPASSYQPSISPFFVTQDIERGNGEDQRNRKNRKGKNRKEKGVSHLSRDRREDEEDTGGGDGGGRDMDDLFATERYQRAEAPNLLNEIAC